MTVAGWGVGCQQRGSWGQACELCSACFTANRPGFVAARGPDPHRQTAPGATHCCLVSSGRPLQRLPLDPVMVAQYCSPTRICGDSHDCNHSELSGAPAFVYHPARAQIRIHTAWAGHPLLNDPLYAAGGLPLPACPERPAAKATACGYRLHCHSLCWSHPEDGRTVRTVAPLPAWAQVEYCVCEVPKPKPLAAAVHAAARQAQAVGTQMWELCE